MLIETSSVSETARRLDRTQPAISRILEGLRIDLGDPLLVKSSNSMIRTARAEELQPLIDSVFELLRSVYRPPDDFRLEQEARTCVVGANDSLQAIFAAPLIERIRLDVPRSMVRFKPLPYPNPFRALHAGEIDVMIAMSNTDDPSCRAELLFESEFCCLCSTCNLNVGETVGIETLHGLPYLDVSHLGVISALTEQIFAIAGARRKTVAAMSSFLAAPEVIANSDMVTLVPKYLKSTLEHHPGVKVVPLTGTSSSHSIRLYWHNSTHFDLLFTHVRRVINAIATELVCTDTGRP